jgi:hypothetical protein
MGSSNSGNLSYVWSTLDGNIVAGQGTPNPIVDAPGTYQLILTNQTNGCAALDLAIVAANVAQPPISILPPDLLTCTQTNTILQGQLNSNDPMLFHWQASNGGNILSGDSTLQPVVDQPGLYTLSATNTANGCTATQSTSVVLDNITPTVLVAMPGPLTCTALSQTLSASGSSAGPEFIYQWPMFLSW